MSEWYKIDNVSKLFLADHTDRNPKTMRVCCTLNEDIDPELLQKALEETIVELPQFQLRIRRGFFWHYMEKSTAIPEVVPESGRPCPRLYGRGYKGILHYRVSYFRNRINIDLFHALSDGTGLFFLLRTLVLNYLKLAHPGELDNVSLAGAVSSAEQVRDSYEQFYDDAESTIIPKTILNKKKAAYHIQSLKLPYDQLQFFEVHLEADKLLKAAKGLGVSLTSYLGARLMLAIHADMSFMKKRKPVTISLPVNLRNYYPSETLRNFFNNVDVSHVFTGDETLETLAKEFDSTLKASLTPEHITSQMNRYQSIEQLLFTRLVPLAIKQPVVKGFARKEAGRVTAVLSNLGPIKVPDEMKPYIKYFTDYCSTENMFTTVTSYGNDLVLGIASAYSSTAVLRRLIKSLQETGTEVTLYSTEVAK